MAPSPLELAAISRAVREAFAEDASGELRLTAAGVEIRPMADGSGSWAVFASGVDGDREVYRRRVCGRDGGFVTTDL